MFRLPTDQLQELRQRLHARGMRRSTLRHPPTDADLAEAMAVVDEYGLMCEVMYLIMAADRRVLNVEREVMKGALDILSGGRVRTAHLEAMLDASARRVAELGEQRCLEHAIERLQTDPLRAEATIILAAAVAQADGVIVPEEQAILQKLADAFLLDENAAHQLLDRLSREAR